MALEHNGKYDQKYFDGGRNCRNENNDRMKSPHTIQYLGVD